MRRPTAVAAVAVAALVGLAAATGFSPWRQPDGSNLSGFVLNCATGQGREAVTCGSMDAPLNVMSAPFVRATMDPIIFDGVTTTPKQFAISKPTGATTYRFMNPCDVDVRIRKVSSLSETVTPITGTRYLARTVEVVGTSNPSFVSIMAVSAPSAPCAPELLYGRGS